jgi:hypothetical protein
VTGDYRLKSVKKKRRSQNGNHAGQRKRKEKRKYEVRGERFVPRVGTSSESFSSSPAPASCPSSLASSISSFNEVALVFASPSASLSAALAFLK